MSNSEAWVTLATNDSYCLGALVLATSLKRVGTTRDLVCLVTSSVSPSMRATLLTVFTVVEEVNVLDSGDSINLALLTRPDLGITFTKLHCWKLVQYSKCVFLDADTLVIQSCDELFEREEFSAAPDAGWPDCFNSGVFVYRPNLETYERLLAFALEQGSFDGGDQGLLNRFFSDWATADIKKHLPFVYNMVASAVYSYLPAYKAFGPNVKIAHFIGPNKPWLQFLDTTTGTVHPAPGQENVRDLLQGWWDIFKGEVHQKLIPEMKGLAGAFAQMSLEGPKSAELLEQESMIRKQAWEHGQIDFLGQDSFDNIFKKLQASVAEASRAKKEKTPEKERSPPKTVEGTTPVATSESCPAQTAVAQVETALAPTAATPCGSVAVESDGVVKQEEPVEEKLQPTEVEVEAEIRVPVDEPLITQAQCPEQCACHPEPGSQELESTPPAELNLDDLEEQILAAERAAVEKKLAEQKIVAEQKLISERAAAAEAALKKQEATKAAEAQPSEVESAQSVSITTPVDPQPEGKKAEASVTSAATADPGSPASETPTDQPPLVPTAEVPIAATPPVSVPVEPEASEASCLSEAKHETAAAPPSEILTKTEAHLDEVTPEVLAKTEIPAASPEVPVKAEEHSAISEVPATVEAPAVPLEVAQKGEAPAVAPETSPKVEATAAAPDVIVKAETVPALEVPLKVEETASSSETPAAVESPPAPPEVPAKIEAPTALHEVPAKIEAIPEAPAKVEAAAASSEVPVAVEEPIVASEAPIVASEAPIVASDAPIVASEAPIVASEAPNVASEAPIVASEASIVATEAPIVASEASIVDSEAPATMETPVAPEAPAKVEAPTAAPEPPANVETPAALEAPAKVEAPAVAPAKVETPVALEPLAKVEPVGAAPAKVETPAAPVDKPKVEVPAAAPELPAKVEAPAAAPEATSKVEAPAVASETSEKVDAPTAAPEASPKVEAPAVSEPSSKVEKSTASPKTGKAPEVPKKVESSASAKGPEVPGKVEAPVATKVPKVPGKAPAPSAKAHPEKAEGAAGSAKKEDGSGKGQEPKAPPRKQPAKGGGSFRSLVGLLTGFMIAGLIIAGISIGTILFLGR